MSEKAERARTSCSLFFFFVFFFFFFLYIISLSLSELQQQQQHREYLLFWRGQAMVNRRDKRVCVSRGRDSDPETRPTWSRFTNPNSLLFSSLSPSGKFPASFNKKNMATHPVVIYPTSSFLFLFLSLPVREVNTDD